ncbi:MAG: Gldg family protein [Cyanobacteriota bacterium]
MKTLKKSKTSLKYLFWLGPILTIMGISAYFVAGEWSPVAVGLLAAGLVLIGLWLVFLGSLAPGFWNRRSTQVGTNAIIATLSVLVLLGLINFLAIRYGQRLDLTENQQFTLSPLSQAVVRDLDQPVKVWIFSPSPNPVDLELLKNYRRYGAKLDYEYVDPQLQPGLAQKFNVNSRGEVYLEYGAQRKLVQTVSDIEPLSEIKLTNSIEQLTSDRIDKVYFLQGHGERPMEEVEGGLSQALNALQDKNFTPLPLNLAERSEVPSDASAVVVAGPKRPLFEGEVEALKNYLSSGGSLLLMIDPETNPGLDSILTDWGVTLDRQVVIDASGEGRVVGLGPATPLVTNYSNHPITQDFGNNYSLYPVARPVEVTSIKGVTDTPLLRTNEQSWAENTPEKQPLQFNPQEGDKPGPLTLGVALSRKVQPPSVLPTPQATSSPGASPSPSPSLTGQANASPSPTAQATASPQVSPSPSPSPTAEATASPQASPSPSPSPTTQATASPSSENETKTEKKASEARLVVIGNSSFSTNGWFDQQLNGDVFLNSVSWLSNRDNRALSIRPKEQENRRLNLTPIQAGILGWTGLFIMPLLGLTTAGIMWWLRR